MASLSIFQRKERHGVLLNFTDHCVQLARLTGLDEKPLGVDAFAEIPKGDEDGVTRWPCQPAGCTTRRSGKGLGDVRNGKRNGIA